MLSTLLLLAAVLPQGPGTPAGLHPGLRRALAQGTGAEVHRVYAVLRERMAPEELRRAVAAQPRGARQRLAAARLRSFADARQGRLLSLLGKLRADGDVVRIDPLWIANAVVFEGTARAIEAVASLPEVERIGWDPRRPVEETWDACPASPLPSPAIAAQGGGFTTYYSQDFEGGVLPPELSVSTTGCGRAAVTTLHGPRSGSFHLVLDSSVSGCPGRVQATLAVDLSGRSTAWLRFGLKDLNDEFDPALDVLEASGDGGLSWVKVADLSGSDGTYVTETIALDPLGLTYGAGFRLRWSWSDDFPAPADGFGLDDIELADGFPPAPPPPPEPNLVGHQAPLLWALGFDGGGVSILSIDTGVDYVHPDLVDRVWSNPLDPVDGIDNDGNGYVDDHLGWDFRDGDNDPYSTESHGTNVAGILVGDGSSGLRLTGMAPGAKLAIARISGEAQHWLAQQWGMSVGIDCFSSSNSFKWWFNPRPDYPMHRLVADMTLAAGIVLANSIGNEGGSPASPVPFQIAAPGNVPSPWRHTAQTQPDGGVSAVLGCGAIELGDAPFASTSLGPSAWEDVTLYDPGFSHPQDPAFWDYPFGGFGGTQQALVKPDLVGYTGVVTTTLGGLHGVFSGTSAATPHLAGAVALLIDVNPEAEPRHLSQALQVSALDLGAPGKDAVFGAGRLLVRDAALRILHLVKASDTSPRLGDLVHLSVHGQPNRTFATLWSIQRGALVTGLGTLDIAPPVFLVDCGNLDAAGFFTKSFRVPNLAGLIGTTVYVQSGEDDRAGSTGRVLLSVVEEIRIRP